MLDINFSQNSQNDKNQDFHLGIKNNMGNCDFLSYNCEFISSNSESLSCEINWEINCKGKKTNYS